MINLHAINVIKVTIYNKENVANLVTDGIQIFKNVWNYRIIAVKPLLPKQIIRLDFSTVHNAFLTNKEIKHNSKWI